MALTPVELVAALESYLTAREAAIAYNNEAIKRLGAKAVLNEV